MKKVFDIESGHYITILNEDDNNASSFSSDEQNSEKKPEGEQKPQTQINVSVETNADIQKLNASTDAENKRYMNAKQNIETTFNKDMQTQNDLLTSAKAAVGSETENKYDSVQTNIDVINIKKKILDLKLKHTEDLCRIELEHAKNINQIENNRLQVLSRLNNEGWNRIPNKYKEVLNESNIHQAKIYMRTLVSNDDMHIIKDMRDFNSTFKDSSLVYGRDKTGYYVLCLDKDDFDKLYSTLQEAGYKRDEIFDVVMPQILDRSSMIDINAN